MPRAITPDQALTRWAKKQKIGAAKFHREMCLSYNHAAMLLRGEVRVTPEILGRMQIVYGAEAAEPIAEAMRIWGKRKWREIVRAQGKSK